MSYKQGETVPIIGRSVDAIEELTCDIFSSFGELIEEGIILSETVTDTPGYKKYIGFWHTTESIPVGFYNIAIRQEIGINISIDTITVEIKSVI